MTSQRESFEKWCNDVNMWFKDFSEYTNLGYPNAIKQAAFEGFKAGYKKFNEVVSYHETHCQELDNLITQLHLENQKLREASIAVIDRWNSPLWKDLKPTGEVINKLAQALGETK